MRSHAVILASALVWLIGLEGAEAKLDILVDKATQRMLVIQDGYIRYMWPVSTGRDNMATPNGSYAPQRLERSWFSREYYDSPMPFSIFFHGGYAIHGSYAIDRLGGPASHGCVRLHPHHAAILFDLVQQEGPGKTTIEITDDGRPVEGPSAPGREDASLQGANPAMPPREIAGTGPGMYPAAPSRDVAGTGPGMYPAVPPRDVAGIGPGVYPPVPPRDIVGGGPGAYPPTPRRVRFREGVDMPELPPALRSNQPPPPMARQAPPRRMLATATANGPPRLPNEPSEPRSKPRVIEAPKVIEGPKVAEGSYPGPAQPGSSSSSIKLLPASCWSGGASRWQWWSSNQGNRCK
jgi:L,D-transpeptidase catalytic domain